jgi:thioredoxin 2
LIMASTSVIVACANCGAKNRVSLDSALQKQPVCGKCKAELPAPAMDPVTVTDANFSQVVESSPVPVLLDLWAAWCGPCRMVAPTIEMLARELAGKVLVGKLDVDANQRTAARFGVQGIPTLLVLKNGREVDRMVGVQSRDQILKKLSPHI